MEESKGMICALGIFLLICFLLKNSEINYINEELFMIKEFAMAYKNKIYLILMGEEGGRIKLQDLHF